MFNMVKKTTTVTATATTDSGNNAPAYDYAIEVKGMVQDWREAEKAGNKRENAIAHAGFRLARILVNDLLPQTTAYSLLRRHTPEAFFTSEEVRKVWKSPEVLTSFVDVERADNDADLTNKVRASWSRTVELAFTIWACRNHYANKPTAVDMDKCLVPAAAFVEASNKWQFLHDNEEGKRMLVAFGTRQEELQGRDRSNGGSRTVKLPFIPSVSAFNSLRGAWLTVTEQRAKRDRGDSKSNAKADPHGVPAMGQPMTATAAPELLTKAFTNLATDGKHTVLPAMAKDEKGKEGIGNMLYAILTNMAVNDADFLRGVIVDAVHDDNAGNALRSMLATVLNDAAKADAVRVSDELHDAIRDPFTATA
jgi:hypothetical protein